VAYSGRYKVKHRNKYRGDPDAVVFRSMWERQCFKWCDDNPKVIGWQSEETVIPYFYEVDKKYHRYFMDLKINFKDGKTVLVEIKPDKETKPPSFKGRKTKRYLSEGMTYVKNMNKWSAAQKYAQDNGYEFQIWTENTLKSMGILPNPRKTIKPLKPLRKKVNK